MKTTTKQFTVFGNIAIVQVKIEPETTFAFRPAGPEIKSGGLIITESTDTGIVGKLTAVNNTESFLILTDADVLAGAKQNRVVNKSVLLSPLSKTVLDVSCVERLRWQYKSARFSSNENTADPDLRKKKAFSMAECGVRPEMREFETQKRVWSHVREKMQSMDYKSSTESYAELQKFSMETAGTEFPACEPDKDSNGIAVFMDSRLVCADVFGNTEVYKYFFPMLRDSAFRMAKPSETKKSPDEKDALSTFVEAMNDFESTPRFVEQDHPGAGLFNKVTNTNLVGFELIMDGQMIHTVIFGNDNNF